MLDRDRGGSYLAVGISGAGMFGVFLFLTFFLQQNLGYTPVKTGLAFLPMTLAIMAAATTATTALLPRTGPKSLVTLGMLLSAGGMILLTGIGADAGYAADILPGLLLAGAGMGLVLAPAMASATYGIRPEDTGVGSAMVNRTQQIVGAIGTALLSTIVTSAITGQLEGVAPSPQILEAAQIHGYTTAFWWSTGILTIGALVSAMLLRPGAQTRDAAVPAMAH